MPDSPTPPIRSWPWLAAAAVFTVLLLATLGIAPTLWYRILPHLEPHLKAITVLGGGLGLSLLLAKSWSAGPRNRKGALVLVVCGMTTMALLLLTFFADATPAGKLHVVEYGVLAYLTLNGLNITRVSDRVLWMALITLLAVGIVDEIIQYLLPNRYFDLLDIAGNWLATGLGLTFWTACSRHSPWRRRKTS